MPKTAIEEMRMLTESEQRDGANGLALALALGEVTKALERVAARLDKNEEKMDDVYTRVVRMESSSSSSLAKENALRINVLEKEVGTWKTRFITAGALVTAFWALFGQSVQDAVGIVVR